MLKPIFSFLALLLCLCAAVSGTPVKNKVAQAKNSFKSYIVTFEDDTANSYGAK